MQSVPGPINDPNIVDSYGQIKIKTKWYNFSTWKPRYKYAVTGFGISFGFLFLRSYITRRPWYARLPIHGTGVVFSTILCYYYGKYFIEYRFRTRDAALNYYMQQHPTDFEAIHSTGRKWRDVMLPWNPVRQLEKVIPWSSGQKPYFQMEPTESRTINE